MLSQRGPQRYEQFLQRDQSEIANKNQRFLTYCRMSLTYYGTAVFFSGLHGWFHSSNKIHNEFFRAFFLAYPFLTTVV